MIRHTQRVVELAEGNAGVLQTARRLADLIRTEARLVPGLLQDLGLGGRGARPDRRTAELVYAWVTAGMLYTPDPPSEELVKSPDALLAEIAAAGQAVGDCDDFVSLLGALYLALGFGVTIVLIAQNADLVYDHVALVLDMEDGRVSVDPTVGPLGAAIPDAERTATFEIPLSLRV